MESLFEVVIVFVVWDLMFMTDEVVYAQTVQMNECELVSTMFYKSGLCDE